MIQERVRAGLKRAVSEGKQPWPPSRPAAACARPLPSLASIRQQCSVLTALSVAQAWPRKAQVMAQNPQSVTRGGAQTKEGRAGATFQKLWRPCP